MMCNSTHNIIKSEKKKNFRFHSSAAVRAARCHRPFHAHIVLSLRQPRLAISSITHFLSSGKKVKIWALRRVILGLMTSQHTSSPANTARPASVCNLCESESWHLHKTSLSVVRLCCEAFFLCDNVCIGARGDNFFFCHIFIFFDGLMLIEAGPKRASQWRINLQVQTACESVEEGKKIGFKVTRSSESARYVL